MIENSDGAKGIPPEPSRSRLRGSVRPGGSGAGGRLGAPCLIERQGERSERPAPVAIRFLIARELMRRYDRKRAGRLGIHLEATGREPTAEELRAAIRRQGLAVIKIA